MITLFRLNDRVRIEVNPTFGLRCSGQQGKVTSTFGTFDDFITVQLRTGRSLFFKEHELLLIARKASR